MRGLTCRLMSFRNKSGILTTYEYDDLGRTTGVIDPRTGKKIIHYNAKGQVDYIEDPDQNRTGYTYDPDSGRKITKTDSLDHSTRYAYDSVGRSLTSSQQK